MKKMLSLVLVLALCLTAVAAYAATPSKVVGTVEIANEDITIIPPTEEETEAATAELEKLEEEGSAAYFGTELTEVDEFGPINAEVGKDIVIGDDGKVEVTFKVDFPFNKDENVVVLLGVLNENKTLTWNRFDGVADGNGAVTARVIPEVLDNASFIAIGK